LSGVISGILMGFTSILDPLTIGLLIAGVIIGLFAGATPGISGTMIVAILLPLTFKLDSIPAFVMLTAVYAVAVFSGSITAVLFRTPGAPEAAATTFDGYTMAKKGFPHKALGYAMFSSFLGGTLGAIALLLIAPQLARFALKFGPAETFALILMALAMISSLDVKNQTKAILMGIFGLFLAMIGMDYMTGVERYTFGVPILSAGLHFIPVLLGLFAVSEALRMIQEDPEVKQKIEKIKTTLPTWEEFKRLIPTYIRAFPLGLFIGILPGVGATTASLVAYSTEVRSSKTPEKFGTGIPQGIAAPECANNAAAMGALVILLALGIPGSATTAVMLGGLILHGLRPGPLLFTLYPKFAYAIMVAALIANILIIIMSPAFIRFFSNVVFRIPRGMLGTLIILFCVVGSFAMRNNMFDVWAVLLFGLVGYVLERYGYPLAPIVIGLVLGSLAETEFRRTLITQGGFMGFFSSPISTGLILVSIFVFVYPFIKSAIASRRGLKVGSGKE
jgi:putative tricarboxylic transport membrane protein